MNAQALGYRADIDGMRAIAVGLVVVFHFRLAPLGEAGFMGVDIFFVLSGFLITRIILNGLQNGAFRLGGFYLARIRRLYPALLAMLALYLGAGYILFLPDQFRELSIEAILSQLYVVNVYFWREVNYFGLHAKDVPLLHMWSLAIEEQFYIFYPLFLMGLWHFARRALLPVLVGVVLASFALGWFASGWKPWAAFYLLPTRAWELGAGGILAAILQNRTVPSGLARGAGPLGLTLIVLAILLHRPDIAWPGWLAALPVLGTVALLLAGAGNVQTLTSRALALAPMVWIGRISYPLYLVHWPVLILMQESLPALPWASRAMGLGLSVLLSWAILVLVETPVRQRRILSGTRPFLWVAGMLTALFLAISAIGHYSGGLPGRFSPEVLRLLSYKNSSTGDLKLSACSWPKTGLCEIGAKGAAPRIGVIGDSHAWALAGSFDLWLKDINQPGAMIYGAGCMAVPNTGPPDCRAFAETALRAMENQSSIETVILVSIWRQPFEGAGIAIGPDFLSGPEAHSAFAGALLQTVTRLQAAGKRVVIIDPFYAAPHKVPRTLARNLAYGTHWPTDKALRDHRAEFAAAYKAFEPAVAAGALRVSLIEELCASGTCPGTIDAEPVFFDNNHLRYAMSPRIAQALHTHIPAGALP